jgi:hypothetical protein
MHSFATVVSLLSFIATMGAATPVVTRGPAGFSGFNIPANLSNGLYEVYVDATGQEIHTLVSTDLVTSSPAPPTLNTRQSSVNPQGDMDCGCGFYVDRGNCDIAVHTLENWAGNGNTAGYNNAEYVISNNVVAFICFGDHEGGVPDSVSASEMASEAQTITDQCGSYVAGTYRQWSWGAYDEFFWWNYGYMQYFNGLNFCGAALYGTTAYC